MPHSDQPPSGADRFKHCAGFPNLSRLVTPSPRDESSAVEGNDAHWVAVACCDPIRPASDEHLLGNLTPSGAVIDDVMLGHVRTYVNHVLELARDGDGLGSLTIEEKVEAPHIHPLAWGHMDAGMYNRTTRTVIVRDLKYGWGIVEPRGLLQLVIYAAAKVKQFQDRGWRVDWIDLGIVQPRPWHMEGPIRNWLIHIDEWPSWEQYAREVYTAAADPNAALTAGEHCADCDAAHECPALRRYTLNVREYTNRMFVEQPTDEQLADEIRLLHEMREGVKSRLAALETVGISRTNAGSVLPGWTTQRNLGKRYFKKDANLTAIGSLFNVKLTEEKPVTPAKAERLGVPKELIKTMVDQPPGAAKLVPCDIQSKAKEVFNNG